MTTERSPLLPDAAHSHPPQKSASTRRLGPLEISPSTRRGILAGIWIASFLSSLNTTLVATLVSSISSEYRQSNRASWLGTSYLLATCTFTPLYGRLCNVMGRRTANQTAIFFAGVGTLCCGLSNSLEMLIVSRFLSGIGGGGILTTAMVITSDMYNMRDRSLTQGIANTFNGLGMGLGGPLGGYISDRFGWRWAFLIQLPLYITAFILTGYNLRYVTPGKGKSAREVLRRIDYGGSATLLASVGCLLFFLSYKYNDELPWRSPAVLGTLALAGVFFVLFIIIELLVAPEPVLAPFLLRQKVPALIGVSNFLVSMCNFAVMYFFPMFFETVHLTSASTAGMHLLPHSISMLLGSPFAGWMMHKTGRYKMLNDVLGWFPFVSAVLMSNLTEHSGMVLQWMSIIPLGFGNAVVLQTTLVALLIHVDHSAIAVATGFSQLWRTIGHVSGVAVASAIFQSLLSRELRQRITGAGAEETIWRIRHSSQLVASLPPTLQRAARDSYAIALRRVFMYASGSTLVAYLVRLGIPEKSLDDPGRKSSANVQAPSGANVNGQSAAATTEGEEVVPHGIERRLSMDATSDGGRLDLEDKALAGPARR